MARKCDSTVRANPQLDKNTRDNPMPLLDAPKLSELMSHIITKGTMAKIKNCTKAEQELVREAFVSGMIAGALHVDELQADGKKAPKADASTAYSEQPPEDRTDNTGMTLLDSPAFEDLLLRVFGEQTMLESRQFTRIEQWLFREIFLGAWIGVASEAEKQRAGVHPEKNGAK